MSAFDRAFNLTIDHEGGYSHDPRDPGGETKFGISKRSYPRENIATLTIERAKSIYRADYWNAIKGDDLPEALAVLLFDGAVNHGVKTAIRMMQRAVGAKDDGVIGPLTIEAAELMDPARFAARFLGERLRLMADLSNWPYHGRGWARRIATQLRSV